MELANANRIDRFISTLKLAKTCLSLGARTRTICLITGLPKEEVNRLLFRADMNPKRGKFPTSPEWVHRGNLHVQLEASTYVAIYAGIRERGGFGPGEALVAAYREYLALFSAPELSFDRAFSLVCLTEGMWAQTQREFSLIACNTCHGRYLTAICDHHYGDACPYCALAKLDEEAQQAYVHPVPLPSPDTYQMGIRIPLLIPVEVCLRPPENAAHNGGGAIDLPAIDVTFPSAAVEHIQQGLMPMEEKSLAQTHYLPVGIAQCANDDEWGSLDHDGTEPTELESKPKYAVGSGRPTVRPIAMALASSQDRPTAQSWVASDENQPGLAPSHSAAKYIVPAQRSRIELVSIPAPCVSHDAIIPAVIRSAEARSRISRIVPFIPDSRLFARPPPGRRFPPLTSCAVRY